ncbi:MAG TPA: type II secretion system F family protein [Acidimicrobiia bacterium]|nr:type II secretion system F family protein [Acidimicrobiia bacterium]
MTAIVATVGVGVSIVLARAARRGGARDRARALRPRRTPRGLPAPLADALGRALRDADLDLAPLDAVRITVLAAGAAALVAGSVAVALAVPVACAAVAGAAVGLHVARARSARQVTAAVPELLEHVASELRAGGSVAGALDSAVERGGPLTRDLERIRSRRALGGALDDALERWRGERRAPGVTEAAAALVVAWEVGGAAADALDALAASLRDRQSVLAEARALATQARLSAAVVAGAPVAYLVWSALVDRRAVAALVGSPIGRVCLVAGLALDGVGALWSRRILRRVA